MDENSSFPLLWILWFLQLICPDHLYEEIEGDLIQRSEGETKICLERDPVCKTRDSF